MSESALQVRVRETLASLGGYWTPANAAVRLLEELGELAEHTLDPLLPAAELAGECADLWIITTALADQFYGFVDEPRPLPGAPTEPAAHLLVELVAAGGRIGRVVNYYDGPKTPRSFDGWLTLEHAVAAFHGHLVAFAAASGVDLPAAIEGKLARNRAVDAGRFAITYDPRTAPVLARVAPIIHEGRARDYPTARLFGAPDWVDADPQASIAALAVPLLTYLKARAHEHLDGFVFGCPPRYRSEAISALQAARPAWVPALTSHELGSLASPVAQSSTVERFVLVRVPGPNESPIDEVH